MEHRQGVVGVGGGFSTVFFLVLSFFNKIPQKARLVAPFNLVPLPPSVTSPLLAFRRSALLI